MAGFRQFFMIFLWNSLILDQRVLAGGQEGRRGPCKSATGEMVPKKGSNLAVGI